MTTSTEREWATGFYCPTCDQSWALAPGEEITHQCREIVVEFPGTNPVGTLAASPFEPSAEQFAETLLGFLEKYPNLSRQETVDLLAGLISNRPEWRPQS